MVQLIISNGSIGSTRSIRLGDCHLVGSWDFSLLSLFLFDCGLDWKLMAFAQSLDFFMVYMTITPSRPSPVSQNVGKELKKQREGSLPIHISC